MIDAPIQREIFPAYLFIIIIIPDSEGSFFSCPTFTFRFCVLFLQNIEVEDDFSTLGYKVVYR
jgi:hypothetical protein